MTRRTALAAALLGLSPILPTPLLAAAHADTPSLGTPRIRITLNQITDGTRVCWQASARVDATWSTVIVGTRSDGTAITYTTSASGTGQYAGCTDVSKRRTLSGSFVVLVACSGGANTIAIDRPAEAEGFVAWSPAGPDVHLSTGSG